MDVKDIATEHEYYREWLKTHHPERDPVHDLYWMWRVAERNTSFWKTSCFFLGFWVLVLLYLLK